MTTTVPSVAPDPADAMPGGEPPEDRATGHRDRASASQAKLVWWAFRKHKLAMTGASVVVLLLVVVVFAEFLAPYTTSQYDSDYTYAPPQQVHFLDTSGDTWQLGPYIYGYEWEQNQDSLRITYTTDESQKIPLQLFAEGQEYRLLGLIPADRHLLGPADPDAPMYLLGTDRIGRDQLTQLIHATRISLSVGLVGALVAFLLGVAVGSISGYFGGRVDTAIQRSMEMVRAVPELPLWLGLAAALPITMSPVLRYLLISVILATLAWTLVAREVRGRFLMLRQEDFVTSAWLDGSSRSRVMFRHMLPSFTSHLIAALTVAIPGTILNETALSWLGLGLQRPVVSWGVLLQEATNIRVVSQAAWLLIPGAVVVVTVLALNFTGDGIRDAADPYRR